MLICCERKILLFRWNGTTDKFKRIGRIISTLDIHTVGAKSKQQVNIYSFAVRCDRIWPSTQWHRVYTDLGNMLYVQFKSVGDFIPEPRCSKFAVGLQTRRRKMGCMRGPIRLWSEGPRVTGAPLCANCSSVCLWFEPGGSVVVS